MSNKLLFFLASLSIGKAVLISLAGGVFYYLVAYKGTEAEEIQITQLKEEFKVLEEKVKASENIIKEVSDIKRTISGLDEQIKKTFKEFPNDVVIADVIKSVDTSAQTSSVYIKSKEPRNQRDSGIFQEVPLRIEAEATYSELALFLSHLSKTNKVLRFTDFVLTPKANEFSNSTVGAVRKGSGSKASVNFDGEIIGLKIIENKVNEALSAESASGSGAAGAAAGAGAGNSEGNPASH